MRVPLLAVQETEEEAAEDPADGMWDGHLEAMWKEMSKEELEEEAKWRRSDQKLMAERITYLQAELAKKDNELNNKEEDVLRQFQVIDRQMSYIDSLHLLLQRCRGMHQLTHAIDQ
jgi:hypothetical protein